MRTRRLGGEAGIVGANLAIVLAFALFAVIQLTRTTIAAEQIDDRVKVIVGEVVPVDQELNNVPLLDETDRMAADILRAAQPLSGQAGEIITTAQHIDGTVSSILSNAGSINSTVGDIQGRLSSLQPVVRSINDGVAAINGRADRIIALVRGIQGDTTNVLSEVGGGGPGGHGGPGGKSIHGHANSIDCRLSILTLGAPGACES
jgi:hypothetical protein